MAKRLGFILLWIGLNFSLAAAQSLGKLDLFQEICDTVSNNLVRQDLVLQKLPSLIDKYSLKISPNMSDQEFAEVVNNLLAELKISHTNYYVKTDPKYYQLASIFEGLPRMQNLFEGDSIKYPSIGIITEEIDYTTFITAIMEGSPAEEAGLNVGDEIVHANGKPYSGVTSLSDERCLLMIRRTADSPRELVTVTPKMVNPTVEYLETLKKSARLIEKEEVKIAYVHMWSYAGDFYHDALLDLIVEDSLSEAEVLVLDLRFGWGGASIDYLNSFNKSIPKMTLVDKQGNRYEFDRQWRKPVVLLVDGSVRSGKELITYSFKKHKLGPVVGSKTAGAISAGTPYVLSDGSILYVAVREVLVDGESLEGKGIEPDIEVPFNIQYVNGADPQLERAIQEAVNIVKY